MSVTFRAVLFPMIYYFSVKMCELHSKTSSTGKLGMSGVEVDWKGMGFREVCVCARVCVMVQGVFEGRCLCVCVCVCIGNKDNQRNKLRKLNKTN